MKKKAINEVNQKVLYEQEQKGIEKGIEQGRDEGRDEGILMVAKNLKGDMDVDRISAVTGLSVDKINSL